ncbi:CLN3 protein [Spironucleus salmonicida]|uniref:CLN3 protein n=1 Tax=Spironucleus salmonicida TaxID=348837 RepID=A0A9P8LXD4_9EUKA|nr:CLN3 protein [Spironucleus salmonicida]
MDKDKTEAKPKVVHEHILTRIAFIIIGTMNNFGYVVGISAALDLVGKSFPKGILLFCDIFPAFFISCIYPMIHQYLNIKYIAPILSIIGSIGYILAGLSTTFGTWAGLVGVIFFSIQSSGEGPFLAYSGSFLPDCSAMYCVGTGLAGLLGSGFYALLTSVLHIRFEIILYSFAFLPLVLNLALWMTTLKPCIKAQLDNEEVESGAVTNNTSISSAVALDDNTAEVEALEDHSVKSKLQTVARNWMAYLSLLLIFICQYSITAGINPTMIFHGDEKIYYKFAAFFLQGGVLIARSTTTLFSVPYWTLPLFSLSGWGLFVLFALQSVYRFIYSIWVMLIFVPFIGICSGFCYSNTIWWMQKRNPLKGERSFALSFSGMVTNFGICIATAVGIGMELLLKAQHPADWAE